MARRPPRASTRARSSRCSPIRRSSSRNSKKVGDKKVGDIETEHITGTLDVAKALDAAKQLGGSTEHGHHPDQAAQLADAVKDPTVDVWIGNDDRVVHRLAFKLNGDFSKVADAQGLKGLSVDLDTTMLPADSPTITPPANPKSSQELLMAVLGGFGPALGLGGLPTATGSATRAHRSGRRACS